MNKEALKNAKLLSEEISSQSNGLFSSVAFCVSLVDVTFHCLQMTKEMT